ncbi:hypothetical protein M5C95_10710 [Acidovorax sp. NCPPB 4044]|nr:hypothetical protein [Acidovorax sp. NCPPB 4044]MDA8521228.1 hypothetical protein [Acidovorax sp. NCPPB 4044]
MTDSLSSSTSAPASPATEASAAPTAAKRPKPKAVPASASPAPADAKKPSTKPARASKAAATKSPALPQEVKPKKAKLVRDSFTIPKEEYAAIEVLKQRLTQQGTPAKKSELLRAGLVLLAGLSEGALAKAMQAIPSIKTGRPKAEPVEAADSKPAKASKARTTKKD